jgi:hypothetical protein
LQLVLAVVEVALVLLFLVEMVIPEDSQQVAVVAVEQLKAGQLLELVGLVQMELQLLQLTFNYDTTICSFELRRWMARKYNSLGWEY